MSSTGVRRIGAEASGNRNDEFDAFWEELQRQPEVPLNKYAVITAYIRMAIKGIGGLALLWATVVLLGGFVSDLTKIDFWCLTVIAFVQAAGVFDALGLEDDRFGFLGEFITGSERDNNYSREKHHGCTQLSMGQWLKLVTTQIVSLTMILVFGPVVYFAVGGPFFCGTLSAYRVIKQDYGIMDGDASKANLKPALNLFYYVSLAHGLLFILYLFIDDFVGRVLAISVSRLHNLSTVVLYEYLQETKPMCVNNPASTDGWNLITYGARLLDSQSPGDFWSGGRVLTMLIDQDIPITWQLIRSPGQRIQRLIGTLAWRNPDERKTRWFAARIVEHLAGHLNLAQFPGALECISSLFDTSCHNNGDQEVLHLPFVISRSISTKMKSFIGGSLREFNSKQMENGERNNEDLVLQGLRILENLAHDKRNCTLIYSTKDLLSRVVAPVSSNKLVEDIKSNAEWTKVVDGSLKVVSRLMGSSGSTGKKMRSLIANNSNAVKNLEAILDMDMKSNSGIIELQMRAIEVLTQVALHHPPSTSAKKLIERTLHIFLSADWMEDYLKDEKRKIDKQTTSQQNTLPRSQQNTLPRPSITTCIRSYIRYKVLAKDKMAKQAAEASVEKKMKETQETASRLKEKAGEALAMLSSDSEAIKIAMMSSDSKAIKSFTGCEDDVHRLTELLSSKIKTIECKISATDTVEIEISTACRISAAVILKNLSNYVKEPTIHKVLEELLSLQAEVSSTTTPRCGEHVTGCITEGRYDIENPSDGGQDKPSALRRRSHIQQCEDRRLQAELLSLVTAICASGNVNFAAILISQRVALKDFVVRLKKMVEDNMFATPACLAIQKLACKMVTELIPHDRNVEVIEKHNIVGALLKASKTMARLESSMLFAGIDRDCHGVDLRPLFSDLAKEAEDLLTERKQELDIDAPPAGVP